MMIDPETGLCCRSLREIVMPDGSVQKIRVMAGGEAFFDWCFRISYKVRMLVEVLSWEFR
jgi:hypothetical protein